MSSSSSVTGDAVAGSSTRRQAYTNTLAHELAHYWFGDLVTMAWWDDTWLNEALGEWMDLIITDGVEPSFRHRDLREH